MKAKPQDEPPSTESDLGRIGEWFRTQEERTSTLDTKLKSLGEVIQSNRTSELILDELAKIRAEVLELRSQNTKPAEELKVPEPVAEAVSARVAEPVAELTAVAPSAVLYSFLPESHPKASKLTPANAEVFAMRELVKRGIEPFSEEWRAILRQVRVRAEKGEDITFDN